MSTYESRSSLGPLNIGIPLDARVAVTTLLNEVLADENILLVKTRKAHWDASGPQFHALHRLWGEQHDLITRRVDQIAERVRMLGRFPIATMRGWLDHSTLHEEQGTGASATEVVIALSHDHEALARRLREAVASAGHRWSDVGTADLLTTILRDHEQMVWMLRAYVMGESLSVMRPSNALPMEA